LRVRGGVLPLRGWARSFLLPSTALSQNETSAGEEDGRCRTECQSAEDPEGQDRHRVGLGEVPGDGLDRVEHGVLPGVGELAREGHA